MTSVAAIASTRAWDEDQPAADEPDKNVLISVLASSQIARETVGRVRVRPLTLLLCALALAVGTAVAS